VNRFFESTIEPLLSEVDPKVIVEVGAAAGEHTVKLYAFARSHGAELHVIDPEPRFTFVSGDRGNGFRLYRGRSLEVLPAVPSPDVVLIDGDHNWYTVYFELVTLQQHADIDARPFPITFLHDVEWPYARRDAYHDPDSIPEAYRQPYALGGVVEGRSELSPTGLNANGHHAVHEGGPRNGILTAIEDFLLSTTDRLFATKIVSGNHGLAIVVDERHFAQHPGLRAAFDSAGA
jgi:uncharacterized protein (DUF2237 family)